MNIRRLLNLSWVGVAILSSFFALPLTAGENQSSGQTRHENPEQPIVLITGSTNGLGRELARELALDGAHIIVHGRNHDRGNALVDEIESEGIGSARFIAADFESLDNVRKLAATILDEYDRLDLLISNAGIWLPGSEGRQVSEEGHELHFQVNYLSGFLLTRTLLPLLKESPSARIIHVSSIAQQAIDFEDVMLVESYTDFRAYSQSKLAQILFTFDLAEELEDSGIFVGSVHPATLMDTHMVLSRGIQPRATVQEGVEAVLNLANSPGLKSGQYFQGLTPTRAHDQAYDPEAREKLRLLSLELTNP